MRVLSVVHQDDAGPGVFAAALAESGAEVSEWRPDRDPEPPSPARHDAAIVYGGAMHVDQEDRHPWLAAEKDHVRALLDAQVPVLGVCLGAQVLAEAAGGEARPAARAEVGWHEVELSGAAADDPLLGALPGHFSAFQWHSYELHPPAGAAELASSPRCLQAFRTGAQAWGIQFHAEVTHDIVAGWIDKYGAAGVLAREGLASPELLAETEARIGPWNELGERLCRRFLELAAGGR